MTHEEAKAKWNELTDQLDKLSDEMYAAWLDPKTPPNPERVAELQAQGKIIRAERTEIEKVVYATDVWPFGYGPE